MMWTTPTFEPFHGKATVGTLSATFNAGEKDEFTFANSVNLDVPDSVDDFYAQAVKSLAESRRKVEDQKQDSNISKLLAVIADRLNALTPDQAGVK